MEMLFQNEFAVRVAVVLVVQGIVAIILFLFAYLTLRKNRTLLTSLLSGFFMLSASGFLMPAIFLPIQTSPLSLYLYELSLLLISISYGFLILFSYNLVINPRPSPPWKSIVTLFIFAISSLISFFLPNGVRYNSDINWVPVYSWAFFAYLTIFLTVMVVIPQAYFSLRIYRKITDKALKRKLKFFLIGMLMLASNVYGTVLYNTWIDNLVFRAFWSVFGLIIYLPSFILIYYGIEKNL